MTFARYSKDPRSARRRSIGHATARPDSHLAPLIAQRLAAVIAIPHSFIARSTLHQFAASHRPRYAAVRVAPKSP
jgi:hypothetical protein